jgi:gliding motility-associated-like protein
VEYTFDHPCSQSIQGSVIVAPAVDASIVPLPELCESGDLVALEAAGVGGVWSSDCDDCLIGDAFDPASGEGIYEIVHTIDDVCTDQDVIEVVVAPQRDAVINLPDWVCLALEGLQPGVEWPNGVWSADCDGCLSESGTIDLMTAGIGVLEVTHVLEGLCGDSDQVQLEIVGCDIELVNVFSPNGDEINDELEFKYLESFPGNRLTIYDRWGGLVLDRFNYGNNWRADRVPEGTYYYILSVPNKETMRGSFMILR